MKRQSLTKALTLGLSATALLLSGCSTTESRISENPQMYQSLSPRDQALVSRGEIRSGMSRNGVYLAWGSPEQKAVGNMRGQPTETWIYVQVTTAPYGSGYYPYYGYGGYGRFGGRFGGGIGVYRTHRHGRFYVLGDPFYDPFYHSYIPPTITIPYKTVTFANGRVMSYQYLVPPGR